VNFSDVNSTEVTEHLSAMLNETYFEIALQLDEDGHVYSIIVIAHDEEAANRIASSLSDSIEGDNCNTTMYGVLCQSTKIYAKYTAHLEAGNSLHEISLVVLLLAFISAFFTM